MKFQRVRAVYSTHQRREDEHLAPCESTHRREGQEVDASPRSQEWHSLRAVLGLKSRELSTGSADQELWLGPGATLRALAPPPPTQVRPADEEAPDPDLSTRIRHCEDLLGAGLFREAESAANDGLREHPGEGRLLLHLSRATEHLHGPDEALLLALQALRAHRSSDCVRHVMHLIAATASLDRCDGERLRRAVARSHGDPALLHAMGVFESMYGDAREARRMLEAALENETDEYRRREIERSARSTPR